MYLDSEHISDPVQSLSSVHTYAWSQNEIWDLEHGQSAVPREI